MLNKRSRFQAFNDGILFVCTSKTEQSSFKSQKNPTDKQDLNILTKLNYQEMSRREQDLFFAERQGKELTMKVRTRLYEEVSSSQLILINDILYSIIDIDKSRHNQEMFIYLEKIRRIT